MKLATWNVNSVRARLERLLAWLDRHQPDVLCLQEIKCQDEQFPYDEIVRAGYHAAIYGQKTYNGVAILSRSKPADVRRGYDDDADNAFARLISADVGGTRVICVYVPNGSDMQSESYSYKLAWLTRLREMLERDFTPTQPLVICGDSNVIRYDDDAADMAAWTGTGLGCEEVRAGLQNVIDWGLTDVFREKHPEGGIFSWWDYRQLGFQRNHGLRLDHILTTAGLAGRCTSAEIDREERKGPKTSDHAPVIAEFQ
jgi:exodeoxyribonuclease-3